MKKKNVKAALGFGLSLAMMCTSTPLLGVGTTASAASTTSLTTEEVDALCSDTSFTRGSVHDPSIVDAGNGSYYVFGSHMGVSKTTDLTNWTSVTSENDENSTLFGTYDEEGNVVATSFNQAFRNSAYDGTVTVNVNGVDTEVDFGDYDASAWNTALDDFTVSGNMWAPDVIYNTKTNEWCMYLSLNGSKWNSSIILLTAEDIEGPYVYQGPVVFSGFSNTTEALSYENTDLELVYGDLDALPEQYDKADSGEWGEYWPHAIDPCVFYDEDGNLILAYGSWSGGIYELQLDENTGLRDYTVSYDSDFDGTSKTITTDAYFGTKIAGGHYVSGEGSYIQHIGDYYYLFMSYGFYSPEGGYNMRIFRSETPDGPYLDTDGNDARYSSFSLNYNADWGTIENYEGERLMTNYQWDTMSTAEVSQGHNSAFVDSDGRAYVVYHTKFNDGTAAHELRVHELFQDENGWLVASPYEYTGNDALDYSERVDTADVIGDYEIIVHSYDIGYDAASANNIAVVTPTDLSINEDGTISGTYTGTWEIKDGTPYCTLTMDGSTYTGVFVKQNIDNVGLSTMCFSVVDESTGLNIWGSRTLSGKEAIALNVKNNTVNLPDIAYSNITLPTSGLNNTSICWTSDKEDILSSEGIYTAPSEDTDVTLTMTMTNGSYSYSKDYVVTAKAPQEDGTFLLASYFADKDMDLTKYADGSLSFENPFYCATSAGLDLSEGVTFSFDATATGTVNVLATLFSLQGNGRLYFTPGSYLGYNALGGWYDANLTSYALVKDYIGESSHVDIKLTSTGFELDINGETAYTESTLDDAALDGTLTDYTNVLTWLTDSASTLTFGAGSWWTDTANASIRNFNCYVGTDLENANTSPIYVDGAKATVKETVPATTITLNEKSLKLRETQTASLTAFLAPANTTDLVTYTSADPSVATVEADGTVTAVSKGKTVITATTDSGLTATCKVTVKEPKKLKLNKSTATIKKGATFTITPKKVADFPNETFTYSSSNEKTATVSGEGVVTGKNSGKAVITVTSSAHRTASFKVKVVK